jgi:hypothetical protein
MVSHCYGKCLVIPVPESAKIIPIVLEAPVLISQQILREGKNTANAKKWEEREEWDEWEEWEEWED